MSELTELRERHAALCAEINDVNPMSYEGIDPSLIRERDRLWALIESEQDDEDTNDDH